MQKKETQQFAKFFLKNIKSKTLKHENVKYDFDELNLSSVN
tara:strand:- start:600 stop:722 length:123 start_codon:yes stop_codon:yes gene_type:complete